MARWRKARPVQPSVCPVHKGYFKDLRTVWFVTDRNWRCDKCPKYTYSNTVGTRQCKICPLGTIAEPGATKCDPRPKNTYRDRVLRNRCLPCPDGTTREPGSAGCKHSERGCPFDTFENSTGLCKACLAGERLDKIFKECVKCGSNEVSRGGDTTVCTKCTSDMEPMSDYSMYEKTVCSCKLGTERATDGRCEPCSEGTAGVISTSGGDFNNQYRSFSFRRRGCADCSLGSTSKPESTMCTKCANGEVGVTEFILKTEQFGTLPFGAAFCQRCPSDSVPDTPIQPMLRPLDVEDMPSK